MASVHCRDKSLSIQLDLEYDNGEPRITEVRFFENCREVCRFLTNSDMVATDRAKREFEMWDDPEVAPTGERYLKLIKKAVRKVEDMSYNFSGG